MKYTINILLIICTAIFVVACENDPNSDFDMHSPQAVIAVDTLEVNKGETVTLSAQLTDESGLSSWKLSYANWKIAEEVNLKDAGSPHAYTFTADITIPADAQTSWLEIYQKHDGSTFEITQTYHKLSLTFYDALKNKNVVYFYIKVRP